MERRPTPGFGTAVVAAALAFSVAVSLYHILIHEAPLLPTLLGQWLLLALSLSFGAAALYALRDVETPGERDVVGAWTGLGYGVAGVTSGGYAWHQHLTPETTVSFDAILFQATFVALVGGAAGVFVGYEKARRERTIADLQAATEELEATEARIRTEKRRFESLFRNAPSAIADLRYADGEPVIERGNDAFEALLERVDADGVPVRVTSSNSCR